MASGPVMKLECYFTVYYKEKGSIKDMESLMAHEKKKAYFEHM